MENCKEKKQEIRITIFSPTIIQRTVYGYRSHKFVLVPEAEPRDCVDLYQVKVKVVDLGIGDEPLIEMRTFVSRKKGEREEMNQWWKSIYQKAADSGSLYTTGLVFE